MRIAYGEEQYNGQEAEIMVPLRENGWYHVRGEIQDIPTRLRRTEFRGDSVSRVQMMNVLVDLKYLLIRAQYHSEQIEGRYVKNVEWMKKDRSKTRAIPTSKQVFAYA